MRFIRHLLSAVPAGVALTSLMGVSPACAQTYPSPPGYYGNYVNMGPGLGQFLSGSTSAYGAVNTINGQGTNDQGSPQKKDSNGGQPWVASLPGASAKGGQATSQPDARQPVLRSVHHGHPVALDGLTLSFGGDIFILSGLRAPGNKAICRHNGVPWECGRQARETLADVVSGHDVTCRGAQTGQCTMEDGSDVGHILVMDGVASVISGGSRDD